MKRFLILVFPIIVAACGEQQALEPAAQKSFKGLVLSLSKLHEEAEGSGNALAEEEFEKRFEKELKKTNRRATSWVGSFVSSSGEKEKLTIELQNDDQTYHLVLIDPDAVNFTKNLKKGDDVLFTGDLGYETSFTVSGALEEPEFRLYPFNIKRPNDKEWVSQSKEKIKQVLAEGKAEHAEAYIEIKVAAQCKMAITAQLRFPESADFSWSGEVVKQDDNQWLYRNTVNAKNALGNAIPHRFYCLAEGAYAHGSAIVSIITAEIIDG